MGLFSSKRKTIVSSSVSRLIQDDAITNRLKQAIIDQLMGKSTYASVGETLINEAPQRLQKKFIRNAKWAKAGTPDRYSYGELKSNFVITETEEAKNEVYDRLVSVHGVTTVINYFLFGNINTYHAAWDKLVNQYGYTFKTNKLNTLTTEYGTDCFLKTGQVYYCTATVQNVTAADLLEPIGLSFDHGATFDRVKDYTRPQIGWLEDTVINKDTFTFEFVLKIIKTNTLEKDTTTSTTISNVDSYSSTAPSTYKEVTETLTGTVVSTVDTTETTIKTYELIYTVSRTFDLLDYEFSGKVDDSNALEEADGDLIDPDLVDDNEVTDYTDKDYFSCLYNYVEDGEVYYGVYTYVYGSGSDPVLDNIFNDGTQLGQHFPKIYFRREGHNLVDEGRRHNPEYLSSKKLCKRMGMDYKDISYQLHSAIGSLDKVKQIALGAFVAINDMRPLQVSYMFYYWDKVYNNLDTNLNLSNMINLNDKIYNELFAGYTHKAGKYTVYKDEVSQLAVSFKSVSKKTTVTVPTLVGIGDVTYVRSEPTVVTFRGIVKGICHVFRKRVDATTIVEYMINELQSIETVQAGHAATNSKDDEDLIIPFDLTILEKFKAKDQEILCGQCLYVVINTSQTIKIKWYQRGAFKVIITIIAVVLALPTGGASLSLLVILQTVIVVLLTQIVLTLLIKVLIKVFNLSMEEAILLYVVAAIATGNMDFSSVAMLANDLLSVLNVAFKIVDIGVEEEYKKMLEEQRKFSVIQQEQLALLEEAKDLLDIGNYVYDPLFTPTNATMSMYIKLGDTAQSYLNRVFLSTEIPSITTGFISNFTEVMLELPQPKYKLGA